MGRVMQRIINLCEACVEMITAILGAVIIIIRFNRRKEVKGNGIPAKVSKQAKKAKTVKSEKR